MKITIIFYILVILLKINKTKITKQKKITLNIGIDKIKPFNELNQNNSNNENQTKYPLHPPPPPPHDLDDENFENLGFTIIKFFFFGIFFIVFIVLLVYFIIHNYNKYNKKQEKILYNKIHLLMKLKENIMENKKKNVDDDNKKNKSQSDLNVDLNAPSVIKNNSIDEKSCINNDDEITLKKEDITLNDQGIIKPSEDDLKLYKPYDI